MANKDVKIFIDFVNGVVGTFYRKTRDSGQSDDFVTIEYYPYNRFLGRKCIYPIQIENKYINHYVPVQKEKMEGIATEFVIYDDPTKKRIISGGDEKLNRRILKLEEENAQLKVKIATAERDLEKANAGASSKVAEAQKTLKTKQGDSGSGVGIPFLNRGW